MTLRLQRLWWSISPRLSGVLHISAVFFIFLTVYSLTAGASLSRHSLAPHFIYLAESFLHGRLDLLHVPDPPYDLTLFAGRWYVSFPPLPSLLMLLPVAIGGLAISDIAFSVLLGAVSLTFLYSALTKLGVHGRASRIWLCLLMGLGTSLWYCAALGSVWYTAHVTAVACLSLYGLEVVGQNRPLPAGLWLGLGFLSRAPVLLAFPLSLTVGLHRNQNGHRRVRFLLLFALGVAPALLGQAAYNWARFGHPLEFGYRWMNSPGPLMERQAAWGQFSLRFLPENLYTFLVRPPLVSLAPLHIAPDPWGMGLLLTCPALLLALPTLPQVVSSQRRAVTLPRLQGILRTARFPTDEGARSPELWSDSLCLGLWLSILLVQIPALLYFNTGSYQFGYRFALDWLPLGVLLVAVGTGERLPWWGRGLIVASILMHLWGVSWMYPNFNGQPWHVQYIELARHLHSW